MRVMTFKGKEAFPLEMLRFDQCYPVDERSINEISNSILNAMLKPCKGDNDCGCLQEGNEYQVTVIADKGDFTIEKWAFYGWSPIKREDLL